MDIYDSRYFLINKRLLKVVGLWPYQNSGKKSLIRGVVLTLITLAVVPQVIGLYTEFRVSLDKFLEHVAVLFYMFIIGFKVITMYLVEEKIKIVYESIVDHWLKITNKKERDILCMYSERGRLLTIGYVGYMISAVVAYTSLPVAPILLDVVFPLNETREVAYILNGEYLIDRRKHYGKIYLLECILAFSTVFVFSGHDTMYAVIVEHSLGIFAIVKYRLQLLVNFSPNNQNFFGVKKKTDAYAWIIDTIRLHKDVVELSMIQCFQTAVRNYVKTSLIQLITFTDVLENTFSSSFLIVIGANSGSLIFTSILILIHFGDIMEMQRHSMVIFGLLIHLFYVSLPGQRLIDHSLAIFEDTYKNEWYDSTKKVKTLLKFMMMRATKPCQLTCGGLYILNFSSFAIVLKSTASYFTVFASFR